MTPPERTVGKTADYSFRGTPAPRPSKPNGLRAERDVSRHCGGGRYTPCKQRQGHGRRRRPSNGHQPALGKRRWRMRRRKAMQTQGRVHPTSVAQRDPGPEAQTLRTR